VHGCAEPAGGGSVSGGGAWPLGFGRAHPPLEARSSWPSTPQPSVGVILWIDDRLQVERNEPVDVQIFN
jgi:hypothetical protein